MARKSYKREYNVQWSNSDFSQDTTHLVSPRTFTSPYRSVGERIVNARNVLVENKSIRDEKLKQSRPAKESQARQASTSSKPLVTKDFNVKFYDESKPPYNMYMYKQPHIPPAEYPYKANSYNDHNAAGVRAAAGRPSDVAKQSGKHTGRVRTLRRPEFVKYDIAKPSRQSSPHRVFTYKKQVTLGDTERGPLTSY